MMKFDIIQDSGLSPASFVSKRSMKTQAGIQVAKVVVKIKGLYTWVMAEITEVAQFGKTIRKWEHIGRTENTEGGGSK